MFTNRKSILIFGVILVLAISAGLILYLSDGNQIDRRIELVKSSSSPKSGIESKIARADYFHQLTRDPKIDAIPPGMRTSEMIYARKLQDKRAKLQKASGNGFVWKFAGPTDVGGRTRALAVDVTNANTLLAGGVSGGIWKSTDRGVTWTLKNTPAQFLSVSWIAQDTRSGHTSTWYYSTGEFSGNSASDRGYTARFYGNGIYKSTNNGETWNLLPSTEDPGPHAWNSQFDYVSKIVVSPATGTVITANNGMGIYRSTDGGSTFGLVLGDWGAHRYTDVEVAANGTFLAVISQNSAGGTQTDTPGIYKSTDDGLNWTRISTDQNYPTSFDRTVLAIAPSNNDVAYALTLYTDAMENFYFHRITISNGQFVDRSQNLPDFSSQYYTVLNAQGGYNMLLSVKPDDHNFIILGLTNLFRSRDGFVTRLVNSNQEADGWIGGYIERDGYIGQYPINHPDHHSIAWDPTDPDKMWNGTDGGIYYCDDITPVLSSPSLVPWQDKNAGYNVTQFYTATIAAGADDERIMGGTQDNGSPFFRFDGSTIGSSSDVSSGDGAYAYFGDNYAYTSSQLGRLLRLPYSGGNPNYSSGVNITPTSPTSQLFINPFRVDPNNENVCYYPAGSVFYRTDQLESLTYPANSGWTNIGTWSVGSYVISALKVSINPAHILYYGASNGALSPRVYRADNATISTTSQRNILNIAETGAYIHDIAINPDDGGEILVVLSNYNIASLFHSSDSGQTYTDVEGNLGGETVTVGTYTYKTGPSIRGATILPTNDGLVYLVATSTGVYSTILLNGSNTVWDQESPQLIGNVVAEYIESRSSDGTVVIGTHGRGIYIGKYDPAASIDKPSVSGPADYHLAQNYPNPFNPATTIEYSLPVAEQVKLTVFDINGRKVTELVNGFKSAGSHTVNFSAENLASGVYIYMIQAGSYSASNKMMLLK